ncbi:MAG: response regulator, partial [Betaproteobacteria bacterium]
IARRLIEMHDGTLVAASAGSGQGSEFTARLPLAAAAASVPPEHAAPHAAAPVPRRLLVVDDHRENADTMTMLLVALGHDVQTAYAGPQAIELASQYQPQAILLDIGLPGMNGYEVARELRKAPQGAQTLLIAVSGYGQDEDRRRSREAGFDHHLVKPVDPAQLARIIDNLATLT